MRRSLIALSIVFAAAISACGSSSSTGAPARSASSAASAGTPTPPAAIAPTPLIGSSAAPSGAPSATQAPVVDDTVWLCKPGLASNPCAGSLTATVVDAAGRQSVEPASPAPDPPIDCFYVYPTVSKQKTVNATLAIDPEERAVATAQAARFSSMCRVYAPMYPQLTLAAISTPSKISYINAIAAYNSVDSSFRNYMANYNHGRPFVVIGHSQGAMMLTGVLKFEVDARPEWRKLLVSALLLGGNVTVPVGKSVGGSFASIPACGSATQTGCVVAYSSFASAPPADALFGRANSVLNFMGGNSSTPQQVLCVNPAAPAGGAGGLLPYYPTTGLGLLTGKSVPALGPGTPWVQYPGQYSAHCATAGGATWLQVDQVSGAGDKRISVVSFGSPTWGLHVVDVNIALGNLVALVGTESAAYR